MKPASFVVPLMLAGVVAAAAAARPHAEDTPGGAAPSADAGRAIPEPYLERNDVALEVTWEPLSPRQGTLFTVRARTESAAASPANPSAASRAPTGSFADEPLHFQPDGSGGWWALAAVPVDAEGSGELTVATGDGPTREEVRAAVAIGAGSYQMERLTVAPGYAAPPDAATAARIERESERALEVARGAHSTPPLWKPGSVVRPRSSRITSGFGNGREFNGTVTSRHTGTDFAGAVGDPVVAPADGIVRIVDEFYLGGRVVYIDHGGGLSSAYLHLSAQAVAVGDTVRAGQRIGSVGATGRVTGPHLHWIVRYGGISVDPLSLLDLPQP